jgi:hypothetical protein
LRNVPFSDEVRIGLNYLLRPGYRPVVKLEEDGRKKRSSAAASNWNPETGEIVIFFEKIEPSVKDHHAEASAPAGASARQNDANSNDVTALQLQQCCNALAEAEKAGKSFIALKWFRDEALPAHHYNWTVDADDRQRVLAKAIEAGAIKTIKIPNPKNPQFPTTTVSLSRTENHAAIASRFNPVPVRGEPVSHTIMRDRGSL